MPRSTRSIPPHFHRFVGSLHVRFVLVRAAERVGTGVLVACAAAIAVVPIVLWQGNGEPLPVVLMLFASGLAIGLLLGILRRPSRMDAASEADGQLRLADLIGTALAIDPATDDPWARAVLALADARCRELSASRVILNRWGARAWGGVGLVTALVLAVSMMAARPQPSRAGMAQDDRAAIASPFAQATDPSAEYSPTRPPSVRPAPQPDQGASDNNDTAQASRPTASAKTNAVDNPSATANNPTAGDPDHVGTGSASTEGSHSQLPRLDRAGTGSDAARQGRTVGGGQSDATAARDGQDSSGVSGTTGQRLSSSTRPWTTSNWPADRERAIQQLRSSPSYEAYRDLIQSYFDRD